MTVMMKKETVGVRDAGDGLPTLRQSPKGVILEILKSGALAKLFDDCTRIVEGGID